jgi:hypothetical protein
MYVEEDSNKLLLMFSRWLKIYKNQWNLWYTQRRMELSLVVNEGVWKDRSRERLIERGISS